MSNELQTTGNNELAQSGSQSQNTQIDKRVSNLEDGGYYKNVVSPEDYLAQRKELSSDGQSQDLELSTESDNNTEIGQKVEPLKHWNVNIQKKFDTCSESQKKAWLDSFKIVEKSFVKQLNSLKEQISLAETILKPLVPYVKDLKKLGQSPQEYIKNIINFDDNLGKNPAYEIAKLIAIHNVTYDSISKNLPYVMEDIQTQNAVSKYIAPLKEEIEQLKGSDGLSPKIQEEAQEISDDIVNKITTFYEQRDSSGKLLYPKAFDYIQDIIELVQTGENLDSAYNLVVNGQRATGSDNNEQDSESEIDYQRPKNRREMTPKEKEEVMLRSVVAKLKR
jgi:hypothetical protein